MTSPKKDLAEIDRIDAGITRAMSTLERLLALEAAIFGREQPFPETDQTAYGSRLLATVGGAEHLAGLADKADDAILAIRRAVLGERSIPS